MNELYPIFLKARQLKILVVGGGYVGLEKLSFLLKSSPQADVSVVSIDYIPETLEIMSKHNIPYKEKAYDPSDLEGNIIVVGATDDDSVNKQIYDDAKKRNMLANIADNPPLCDFYMGGIVTKGSLKVAISTNGKSPTMAKRLRQLFEQVIPDNIDDLLDNINAYRKTLVDDFQYKVDHLNELTKSLVGKHKEAEIRNP